MDDRDTLNDRVNLRWLIGTGLFGLTLMTSAIVGNLYWGWPELWLDIQLEIGAAFMLAAVLFLLERRFARAVQQKVDTLIKTLSGPASPTQSREILNAAETFHNHLALLLDENMDVPHIESILTSEAREHEYDAWYDSKLKQAVIGTGLLHELHVVRHLVGHHYLQHFGVAQTSGSSKPALWGHGTHDGMGDAQAEHHPDYEVIEAGLADYLACSFVDDPTILSGDHFVSTVTHLRQLNQHTDMSTLTSASSHEKGQVVAEILWELRQDVGRHVCDKAALLAWREATRTTDLASYGRLVTDSLKSLGVDLAVREKVHGLFSSRGVRLV